MESGTSHGPHLSELAEPDVIQYRPLSGMALVGLLMGLATPLAFLHVGFWVLPVAGLVLNGMALWRIAQPESNLVGRKAAVVGLLVSTLVLAGAPAEWLAYRWLVSREARQFAAIWFEMLARDEPHKAHQLTLFPDERAPFDEKLWQAYYEGSDSRRDLGQFVSRPGIRALLALGSQAMVRYYQTQSIRSEGAADIARQAYAVTYTQDGSKKTFFFSVLLRRYRFPEIEGSRWQVIGFEGGIRPPALGGEE